MIALKARDIKYNFKEICTRITGGETMIVSRPHNENIVLISEKRLAELEKAERNQAYLDKIDRGIRQKELGKMQVHELIEE